MGGKSVVAEDSKRRRQGAFALAPDVAAERRFSEAGPWLSMTISMAMPLVVTWRDSSCAPWATRSVFPGEDVGKR
jgi:hypothetical protein